MTFPAHIYRLERCPLSALRSAPLPLPDGVGVWWESSPSWEEVPLVGLAALTVRSEVADGCRLHHTTLEATLACPLDELSGPALYRLTAASGRCLLVGLTAPPHPVSLLSTRLDSRPSAPSAVTLTVEWHSPHPPLLLP